MGIHQRSYSRFRTVISQLSMLRVLRLLQIGHMSQAVRHHRAFRELRLMLYAFQGVFKSLLWSLVMVFAILFSFGIIFTEGSLAYCVFNNLLEDDSTKQLRGDFGTLSATIFTLFKAMSNGVDWGETYDSLSPLHWLYRLLFLFFEAFNFIVLLNVVTSVFVESTMQRSQMDRESVVADEIHTRKEFLESVQLLFEEFDVDGTGDISFEELKRYIKKPVVSAYFATLGVDASQIGRLFDLLDKEVWVS